MEEIWKDVEGYEGLYQVSSLGRVKSFHYHNGTNERILKSNRNSSNGYDQVILVKDGHKKGVSVHRLVAIAFIKNPLNLPYVGHKDEDSSNNSSDNLEWVTQKDNNNMPKHIQRISDKKAGVPRPDMIGQKNPKAVPVLCDGIRFETITECAKHYHDVSYAAMKSWLSGRRNMPKEWKDRGLRYDDLDAKDEVGV